MKKLFIHLLAASSALAVNAQNTIKEDPFMVKNFSNEIIKAVEVKTSGGSIAVSGASPGEFRVEVYIRANNTSDKLSKEEIQERLNNNYDVNISFNNNKISAIAKPKDNTNNWKNGLSIAFKVWAPSNITSDLLTAGGSISLKNVSGAQNFSTSGGSLYVDNVSGKISGRTSGGSIHIANSKDAIDLTTSGGSIHAENCTGNLQLITSGGSIKLNNLNGNIRANTSGGSITGADIKGELSTNTSGGSIHLTDLACSLETSTNGGGINVAIKELGKYVRITNSSGNINLTIPKNKGVDLSLAGQRVSSPALTNFNGSMDNNEIEGKINGGGIQVTARAVSGRVNLEMN